MHVSSITSLHHVGRPEVLREAVDHAAHLLPAQGPIGVFIHQNTLHAFQHMPFEEAVVAASETYGTEPFMTESAYREQLAAGRILEDDLVAVAEREPNEVILPGLLDRRTLRTRLLSRGQREFDAATVDWVLAETRALDGEGKKLLDVCLPHAEAGAPVEQNPKRLQAGLLQLTGVDLDRIVHPLLIRLSAVFLDQRIAYWPMPNRQLGFLQAVRSLFCESWAIFPEYLEGLGESFGAQGNADAVAVVCEALDRLGVPEDQWESFIEAELLALPGWAGIMLKLQQEPLLAPHVNVPCSLMEFLAVRLTLELVAASSLCRQHGCNVFEWRDAGVEAVPPAASRLANAANLAYALRRVGLSAQEFSRWNPVLQRRLVAEVQSFHSLERRRLFHLAYEYRHEQGVLQALALYSSENPVSPWEQRPFADVFFCIDEREESTRRHLEEVAPQVRTHGAAGFFGVAMDYAGLDDAHGVALCPVVVKPQHAVREQPAADHSEIHQSRVQRRKTWASSASTFRVASRWSSTRPAELRGPV